jgi:hypothetical protein
MNDRAVPRTIFDNGGSSSGQVTRSVTFVFPRVPIASMTLSPARSVTPVQLKMRSVLVLGPRLAPLTMSSTESVGR